MYGNLVIQTFMTAAALIFGASCSSVNKMALRSTSQILEKGSAQVNRQADWTLFKEGAPANLMMLEGMSHADPENLRLLSMLVKAYGGYAYGVLETEYFEKYYSEAPIARVRERAVQAYSKALNYGRSYLALKGIDPGELDSKDALKKLPELFGEKLGDDDMPAVFFTAQALGGLINLQKHNVALLSKIGAVKAMADWVCARDPSFELGSCDLFKAMYESSRPAMLGGDLEKGKRLFLEFIKKRPENLLARTSYLQYYVAPMMDDVEYARQREALAREFDLWERAQNAGEGGAGLEKYRKAPEYNLYNAIAKRRFEALDKNRDKIF